MYVHVPTVWVAYLAFVVTALCSACTCSASATSLGFDRVAGASAEIGVAFMALTLITGSLWGRITWGVFWQWDARLTTTAMLFVSYIGYLAVRSLGGSHHQRARRSAVIGLLAVLEIPLVHWSVHLWRSLHQEATVADLDGDVDMDGLMLFSLFVGLIAFTLMYLWLLLHRSRAMAMQDVLDDQRSRSRPRRPPRRGRRDGGGDGRLLAMRRRLHPRQLRRDDRRRRRPGVAVHAAQPPAGGAGRRRRQVLDLTRSMTDLSPRPAPRRRAPGVARAGVAPDRRDRAGARRRRRDRHPVPALGGRLLLQRRRGRQPFGLRRRSPFAAAGRRRARLGRRRRRRHRLRDRLQRRRHRRPLRRPARRHLPRVHPRRRARPLRFDAEVFAGRPRRGQALRRVRGRQRRTARRRPTPLPTSAAAERDRAGGQPRTARSVTPGCCSCWRRRASAPLVDRAGDRHRQPPRRSPGAGVRLAGAGGAVLAVFAMQRALETRDYSLAYVQQVGSRSTPGLYNVAAMWSALEGSILLWVVVLSGFTAAVAWRFRKRADDTLVGWALVVMLAVSRLLRAVAFGPANPFAAGPAVSPVRRAAAPTRCCRTTSSCCSTRRSCTSVRRLHGAVRVRDGGADHRPRRRGLAARDTSLGAVRVGVPDDRHPARRLVELRGARLVGRLGVGSGRERLADAVAHRHRLHPLGARAAAPRDAAGVEPQLAGGHLRADDPRHVPHPLRGDRQRARLLGGEVDGLPARVLRARRGGRRSA